ncbi:zinc finger protein 774-like isoform X2 [Trichomycterus rosablanca]|uniref:zinc finger protein 774-like isoform X2 n=1 Tax=Trichomycterus rosablanca TaxID=2290929 RepID=UPI002F35E3FE
MEKTPAPPSPPSPVSSPSSAEQSVRKPRSVESLQAERRRDRSRSKSRINLGQAFTRWRELRRSKDFKSDPEFASFLLDRYQGIKHVSRVHRRTRLMPDAPSDGEIDSSNDADAKQPAEIEINLGLTRSVREKTSVGSQERRKSYSEAVQSRLSASDEEESCSLSGNHVVLTKEVLVLLMYRCLECSGPCRIWGLGKGGSLSFGQECVKCSHYRVWTSHPAVQPTQKVADKSQSHDHESRRRRIEACVNTDARDVSRFAVKEEPDEDERTKEEHVPPLLLEAHEDDDPSALNENRDEDADGSDLRDGPPNTQEEPINDQNRSVNDDGDAPSDEEYEDPSSSCEATENEELSESECDRKLKPFQNTIKPIIWCTDCQCVAKMVCTIRRHLKIFGCRECGVVDDADRGTGDAPDDDVEKKQKRMNFSVYFGDVVSFHKHAMSTHGAKENPVEQRVCQDCNKIIRVKKKVHVCEYKIKPFFCPLCPKRFFTENGRKVHVRRLHGDYTHFCKFCMTPFATKASKLEHERRHGDGDLLPFSCPDCPEKFKDFITRNQHMRGHTGQNRFICDACYRTLPTLTSYERHMRIHSGEKPYSCGVCERSFNQAGHLKSHMRLHTGERPFMCEQCGECFNHNVSLKNHLQKRHAGLAASGEDGSSETPSTGRGRKRDRTSSDDPAEKMETEEGYRSQSEPSDDDECPKRGRKTKVRTKRRAKNNIDEK